MHVAIVDDEQKERDTLQSFVARFGEENPGFRLETTAFDSGDAFLAAFGDDPEQFAVVFFDIEMPGINGMDTARRIREKSERITILFITNVASYAIDGYEVGAADYILKPVSYHDFSVKFGKAVRRAQKLAVQEVALETSEGIRKIRIAEVKYIEVLGHYVIWHLDGGEVKVRGTIRDTLGMVSRFDFCQVHKSFLINLARVEKISSTEAVVAGERVAVGRRYYDQLLQEFMKYMRG